MLLDPPYDDTPHERLASHLARILAPDGLLVYETAAETEPEIEGLTVRTSRRYGSAAAYAVRAVITAICPGSYDPVTNGHST